MWVMSHPWILVFLPVAVVLTLTVYLIAYGPEKFAEEVHAFRAEANRLYVERMGIHNDPAGTWCMNQRRVLMVPIGPECGRCAATMRQYRALVRRQNLVIRCCL